MLSGVLMILVSGWLWPTDAQSITRSDAQSITRSDAHTLDRLLGLDVSDLGLASSKNLPHLSRSLSRASSGGPLATLNSRYHLPARSDDELLQLLIRDSQPSPAAQLRDLLRALERIRTRRRIQQKQQLLLPAAVGGLDLLARSRVKPFPELLFSWRALGRNALFTWKQAATQCYMRGLRLVSLNNARIHNAVAQVLLNDGVRYAWTSGYRDAGKFVWGNGLLVGAGGFTAWSTTGGDGLPQPDDREGGEECLALLNNFYNDGVVWHDINCGLRKPFICERIR